MLTYQCCEAVDNELQTVHTSVHAEIAVTSGLAVSEPRSLSTLL